MPFAGHTPIHARWSEHHRPTATATQTGTCRITRPAAGGGTLDGAGVWHPPTSTEVYRGPCRIAPPGGISNPVVGDQRIGITDYQIAVRWDTPEIMEGDIVEVLAAADPLLPGRLLQVTDTVGGGGTQQWERVLTCSQDITHRDVP
ncbi:DUF6093 family protein [Streptosporangium sp. NPDC051023]|uniref:DUF6093 family protein n=1 Tax=Streptosporangium sp. NPDC051023 TaxID=3155410 RepID=UPI00344B40C0